MLLPFSNVLPPSICGKRKARDSNPQSLSGHLSSGQGAIIIDDSLIDADYCSNAWSIVNGACRLVAYLFHRSYFSSDSTTSWVRSVPSDIQSPSIASVM